jgi:hypothetical protein
MSGKRYSDEFKAEAAKQVIDQGCSVREVSTRLGVSIDSLYGGSGSSARVRPCGRRVPRWRWRTVVCRPPYLELGSGLRLRNLSTTSR